jgi:predicted RNase H-like HicB family nuclease
MKSRLIVAVGQDASGKWTGKVAQIPGVQAHGKTRREALSRVRALALRALAERVENGEQVPEVGQLLPDLQPGSEDEQMGQVGSALAGIVWDKEDFSDWEGAGDGKASPR